MGIADGHRKESTAGLPKKQDGFLGVSIDAALGVTAAFLTVVMLGADKHAQFAFDDAVVFVGIFDNSFANLRIFLECLVASVDHHTGEAFVEALLAKLERIAMVEMNGDGN